MKIRIAVTLLSISFSIALAVETIEDHYPLEKVLDGISTFNVRGDSKLDFEQDGDTAFVKLRGVVIAEIKAPQFIKKVIKSPSKEYLLVLIDSGKPMAGGGFGSNYHSILRLQFDEKGDLAESKRLLEQTSEMMKGLNRWVVKIDSVLNDGRTVRLYFGEQKAAG